MTQGLAWLFIVLVASGVGLVMTGVWMLNYPPGFILTGAGVDRGGSARVVVPGTTRVMTARPAYSGRYRIEGRTGWFWPQRLGRRRVRTVRVSPLL